MEFSQCLPSPTVMISLGMKPYDGNAVLEINPTLVYPILEMVLGGTGNGKVAVNREVTDIERSILDGIIRIILHDLRDSWQSVSHLAFSIEGHETEPQLLQILAPNEAVVAVSMEVRIGDNVGMINIGVPSIIIKMLRQKFDQQWSLRKTDSTEQEQKRALRLLHSARLLADGRLTGARLSVENFLNLTVGDVLAFDLPIDHPVELELNGKRRFRGQIVEADLKRAFLVEELALPESGYRDDRRPLRTTVANPA